jgi:hypothetical protein
MRFLKYTLESARFNEKQCPKCSTLIYLAIIQPGRPSSDPRTFECPDANALRP